MVAGLFGTFIICQSAGASDSGVNPAVGPGMAADTTAWAVRRERESAVNDGFADPRVGNAAGPATYAFAFPWNLPLLSVIDAPTAPMNNVPASWCVVPRKSCQKPRPAESGCGCADCH